MIITRGEGRNPMRWRLDAVGNPVLNALKGCDGCACHEYDHIVPWSRGGGVNSQIAKYFRLVPIGKAIMTSKCASMSFLLMMV